MIVLSYLTLLLGFFATNSAKIVRGGLPHAKKTNTWVANGRQEIPSGPGSADPGSTASVTVQDAASYDKGKSESEKNSDEKNLDINVFLPKKKRFDEGFSMPLQHGNGFPVPVDGGSVAMPMINELSRALERQQMSQEMSHMSHAISQTMVDALLLAGKHDDHGHHIEEIFHHDDDDYHHHHHHDDHDDHHYDHGLTLHDLEYAFDHFPHHDGVKEDEIVRALKSAFHSVIKEVRDKKKGDQTIVQAIPETQSAPETETEIVEAPPAPEAPTPPPAQPAADIVAAAAAPPPPPPPTVVSAPPPPPPPPIISAPPPPPPPPPIISAPPPPPPPPPIISAPPPPPPPPPIISAPPPPPPPPPIISSPPAPPPPPPVISAPPPAAVPPPVIAAPAVTQPAALPSVAAQPAGNVVANSPAALPGALAGGPQAGALQPGALQPGALQPGALQPGALQPGALQPGALQAGAPQSGGQQAGVQQAGVPQAGVPQAGGQQAGDQDPHHTAGVSDSHTTGGGPQTSQAAGQTTQPNAAQTAPPVQQPGTTSSTEPSQAANQAAGPLQQTPSVSQGQPGAIKDFKEGSKGYKILGDILAQAMLKAEKKLERGMQGAVMESERNKKIVQEHTANDNSNKEIEDDDTTLRSSEEGDNIDRNGGTYEEEHNGDTAEEGSAQWHDEAIEPNNRIGKDLSYSYERHHNPSDIKVAEPRPKLKGKSSKILRNGLKKTTAKKASSSSLKDEKRKKKAYRASSLIRSKTKQKTISKPNNGDRYNEDEETQFL
ncbi:YLP motif-containing protein 1-like [Rhopilema esculentum]|uniref:YLP motif-containing protein 1-like n=1 Tax=Rhopilema esculentum TaxID=499914 RepID=UPI0031E1C7DE